MLTHYHLPPAGKRFRHEIEIKRSRFIATAVRAMDEAQAREFVDDIRREFPDARHNCSAFYLQVDGANPIERSSDDGEPSGTAGTPMLEQLKGSGLMDIAVVVTRYFGGIKLGAGGLVHAYSESVGELLPDIPRVERRLVEMFLVDLPHAEAGRIEAELRNHGFGIEDVAYGQHATYTVSCNPGGGQALADTLSALTRGGAEPVEAGQKFVER